MATIQSTLSLFDGMSGPLQSIHRALNIVLNSFEAVQSASGNAIDASAIRDAREELARAGAAFDAMEENIRQANQEQENFNKSIKNGTSAAGGLEGGLKNVLKTAMSIGSIKIALGWVKENLELADIQRNAENQLKAVLANMGVGAVEVPVTVDTETMADILSSSLKSLDGNTATINIAADTTQTMSAFDAISAKASEIQGKGIYGDEAMLAGAAEFATYFTDAGAIMSMMDTLSDYAMGMSGGGALDSSAMVDYATGLGKIMSGSYDAMTKKGFSFTDAQKAVIEGTATHAQYVEALGEDYASLSEDMQAATVINNVIAEGWGGLYETMSNTPEGKIIQFQNSLGDLREMLGNRLYPAVLGVFDVFTEKFPQIEKVLTWFADGCAVLITVLGRVAGVALNVASAIVDNWDWIGPVIMGVATALAVYNAVQLISTAAQAAFNAVLMACPLVWVVVAIAAVIAAVVALMRHFDVFGAKSNSVFGTLTGCINVAIQFFVNLGLAVANIALGIWNALSACCENIGIAFHNVIANVQGWFYGLLATALTVVEGICAALNKLPFVEIDYSGISSKAEEYAAKSKAAYDSQKEYRNISDAFDEGFSTFGAFSKGWAKRSFENGAAWGDGLFSSDSLGLDTMDGFAGSMEGVYKNTGDTAANTAATANSLDYMDEDLVWMKDIAEREAINRYTTAQITVEQHNENYISKDADPQEFLEVFAFDFAEQLENSGEGVHS